MVECGNLTLKALWNESTSASKELGEQVSKWCVHVHIHGGESDDDDSYESTGGIPARIACEQSRPCCWLNAYPTTRGCSNDSCSMKYGDLPRIQGDTIVN